MTLTEYQERMSSLLDQHLENLDSEPQKALDSYLWLMNAVNSLLKEYYGVIHEMDRATN